MRSGGIITGGMLNDNREERFITHVQRTSSPQASHYIKYSTEKNRGPISAYKPKFIKKMLDDVEVRPAIIPPNFTYSSSPLKKSVKKTVSSSKKKLSPVYYKPVSYSIKKGRETSPKGRICFIKLSHDVPTTISPAK